MKQFLLIAIKAYQKTLSFDHGPLKIFFPDGYCRFRPTCSQYSYEAISRFGSIRGSWLSIKRIIRCNPWNKGGEDPIPDK